MKKRPPGHFITGSVSLRSWGHKVKVIGHSVCKTSVAGKMMVMMHRYRTVALIPTDNAVRAAKSPEQQDISTPGEGSVLSITALPQSVQIRGCYLTGDLRGSAVSEARRAIPLI